MFSLVSTQSTPSGLGAWSTGVTDSAPTTTYPSLTETTAEQKQPFEFMSAPRQPREPLAPETKRRIRIGGVVAGSAIGVVVLGFVAVAILNSLRGPDLVVQEYLDDLVSGDADAAAAIVDPGVPTEQRVLLSNEALKAADNRLAVEAVDVVDRTESGATVSATLSVDGERFTHTFNVASAPKEFLFLDAWRMTAPLIVPIEVAAPISGSVRMGDVEVPATGSDPLYVYPGTYTFTAPESPYLEATPVTVRLLSEDAANSERSAAVEESPTEELEGVILAEVQKEVTACATVPTNLNELCPSSVQAKNLAALTLKTLPDGFDEVSATHFVSNDAVITIQRDQSSFFVPEPRDIEFSLQGTIEFQDGEPVVEFVSNGWF